MINRLAFKASPKIALNKLEIFLLNHLIKYKSKNFLKENYLSIYLLRIAKLGGYLARTRDPLPGNIVMWRGSSRLTDIELGFLMKKNLWVIERSIVYLL